MLESVKINDSIYWVGVQDSELRVFDIIMETKYGTSYNSYIVKGSEKIALVETVKELFFDQFLERARTVCELKDIDYIIVNHTEPDHSGSLKKLLEHCPNAIIYCSKPASIYLKNMVNDEFRVKVVSDGDTLSLGDKTFKFMLAPFLHWPDTMFSHLEEENIIFTCDFLGCHYSSGKTYNDEVENNEGFQDAFKYYYECIMSPFKPHVLKALDRLEALKIKMVCTGHGPILRNNIKYYMDLYRKWSTVYPNEVPIVVIAYVSAYGYTGEMARLIEKGLKQCGKLDIRMFDMVEDDLTSVVDEIQKADGVIFGTPTILGDALPPILDLTSRLNPVINKEKLAAAFGACGWSGEGVDHIQARLKQLKLIIPVDPLKVIFRPSEEDLKKANDFGKKFGEAVLQKLN